ncbi:MAG: MFS transporter [Taibaiella sp.]|nr:MFS transporter [Taibaiella sp.]
MNKPVILLLLIATIDRIILQGIYPLLPVMIADLGVSARDNGIFMAVTYLSIAAGSFLTPRILGYYGSVSRLSVWLSVFTAVSLAAMGCGMSYAGFLIATSAYWFFCGVQINIYSIIMSYISPPKQTGSNFGLLANTTLMGAVIGSFFIGPVIHNLGILFSFILFGVLTVLARTLMLFSDFDVVYSKHNDPSGDFRISARLWLLLIVFNTGIMLSFIGRFNLSLIMREYQYDMDSISYIFAWGALIVFPFPYLFGLLSQRVSGKLLLVVSVACATIAIGLLYNGNTYFSFISVSFLICIMTYCSRGVSQKIIYDIYPLRHQTHAQSVLSSANWVAAIIGFLVISATSGTYSLQEVSLLSFIAGVVALIVLVFSNVGRYEVVNKVDNLKD